MQFNDVVTKQLEYFKEYFDTYKKSTEHQKKRSNNGSGYQIYRTGEQHLIENYEEANKANFKRWHLHHRLEFTIGGDFAHSVKELIRLGVYYDRPYFELIYLPQGVHTAIHNTKNQVERDFWIKLYKV